MSFFARADPFFFPAQHHNYGNRGLFDSFFPGGTSHMKSYDAHGDSFSHRRHRDPCVYTQKQQSCRDNIWPSDGRADSACEHEYGHEPVRRIIPRIQQHQNHRQSSKRLQKRKSSPKSRQQIIKQQHRAATTIQRAWRKRMEKKVLDLAAHTLQRFFRHIVAQTRMARVLEAFRQLRQLETELHTSCNAFEMKYARRSLTRMNVLGFLDSMEKICQKADGILSGGSQAVVLRRKRLVKTAQDALAHGDRIAASQL